MWLWSHLGWEIQCQTAFVSSMPVTTPQMDLSYVHKLHKRHKMFYIVQVTPTGLPKETKFYDSRLFIRGSKEKEKQLCIMRAGGTVSCLCSFSQRLNETSLSWGFTRSKPQSQHIEPQHPSRPTSQIPSLNCTETVWSCSSKGSLDAFCPRTQLTGAQYLTLYFCVIVNKYNLAKTLFLVYKKHVKGKALWLTDLRLLALWPLQDLDFGKR